LKKSDSATIKNAACRAGMVALREAGLAKALAGQTTLEEVMRVTQEEG
jgi:general secretion pathway protein E